MDKFCACPSQVGKGELRSLLLLMHPQPWGWITLNTNRLATCSWSVLSIQRQWQKKTLKADYSTTRGEGGAVSGLTVLSCGNALQQQWMSTCKAGGREGQPRHRARGGKRRWTHTPQPLHRQCPAVSAAVRQQKPVPARNDRYRSDIERSQCTLKISYYIQYI